MRLTTAIAPLRSEKGTASAYASSLLADDGSDDPPTRCLRLDAFATIFCPWMRRATQLCQEPLFLEELLVFVASLAKASASGALTGRPSCMAIASMSLLSRRTL